MSEDPKPIDRPLVAFDQLPYTTQQRLIANNPGLREELAAMEAPIPWPTGRNPSEPASQYMDIPTGVPAWHRPGAKRRVFAKAEHINYADLERRVATYSMQESPRYRRSSVNILVIPLLMIMTVGQLLQLPGKAVVVVANRTHKLLTGYTVEELT